MNGLTKKVSMVYRTSIVCILLGTWTSSGCLHLTGRCILTRPTSYQGLHLPVDAMNRVASITFICCICCMQNWYALPNWWCLQVFGVVRWWVMPIDAFLYKTLVQSLYSCEFTCSWRSLEVNSYKASTAMIRILANVGCKLAAKTSLPLKCDKLLPKLWKGQCHNVPYWGIPPHSSPIQM